MVYATTFFAFIISSTASASIGISANRSIGLSRVTRMLFSKRIPSFYAVVDQACSWLEQCSEVKRSGDPPSQGPH